MNISLFPNNIVNNSNMNVIVPRTKYTLKIKMDVDIPDFCAEYYMNKNNKFCGAYSTDSGLDLIVPQDVRIELFKVDKVDFKIKCEMVNNETGRNAPYYIYPRSSISNTNFMLANSVGIIDANYRGPIMAKFRCFDNDENVIKHMSKMVQICTENLSPFTVQLVSELSQTDRGENGFGSTDRVLYN
jgi:dUTP pyrophosphatase